jgi:hypothetical protein
MNSFRLRAFRIVLFWLLGCLFVGISPSLSAQNEPLCSASPEVKTALDQIPADRKLDQSAYQFEESRLAALRDLKQRYAGDVFVQSMYIANMSYGDSPWNREKVIAEYKILHEQRPDDLHIGYLYGRTLLGRDTPQSIKLFTIALEKDPNFPSPHIEFIQIYSSPNFLDKAKALSHVEAFISACPDNLNGYSWLRGLDDKDFVRQSAVHLRQILEPRTDSDALSSYTTLWSLEFSAHPASEYDGLRKQVSADLTRLRALNLENSRQWWYALEEGYKLTNEQKESDWAADESARHFPSAWSLPESTQWFKVHPYPASDAPAEKKTAYFNELLKQTNGWLKQRPNLYYIWSDRLDALKNLDDSPPTEIESCLAKVADLAQADNGPNALDSNTDFQFAGTLYDKKLEPLRQLEFAQKGLDQLAVESKQPSNDMYSSKKEVEDQAFWNTFAKFSGHFYEVDAYIRLRESDKAQSALTESSGVLQALKSQINDEDKLRHAYSNQESFYWFAMADLATLQNHQLDAMAFYQSALLDSLDAAESADLKARGRLEKDARTLWASLGGTDDGWKSWYGNRADALASQSHLSWENAQDPLPPFQLTDLQGKTWRVADLKGKVVFLNFWASW